jgi:hypothetical protein
MIGSKSLTRSADPIGAAGATRLLAKGGDWAALAYAGSETAPPYVCFVRDPTAKLDLRAERGLRAGNRELALVLATLRHWGGAGDNRSGHQVVPD